MSGPVDQLDARLIALLRDEPRIGLMEVARRLQVARDTEHLQDIVNRLLSNPAIRRSTSYIALSEQIPYRTGPLLMSAAGQETSSTSGPTRAVGATSRPNGSPSRGSSLRTSSPAA